MSPESTCKALNGVTHTNALRESGNQDQKHCWLALACRVPAWRASQNVSTALQPLGTACCSELGIAVHLVPMPVAQKQRIGPVDNLSTREDQALAMDKAIWPHRIPQSLPKRLVLANKLLAGWLILFRSHSISYIRSLKFFGGLEDSV